VVFPNVCRVRSSAPADAWHAARLMTDHSGLFWGVIASMYIGNLMLLILNIPLVGIFIQLLRVRQGILVAFSLLIVLIGV
jgi:putative tricarboxylic transport membrane protein